MIISFENFAKAKQQRRDADFERNSGSTQQAKLNQGGDVAQHTISEWPSADLSEFYRVLGSLQRSGFDVELFHGATDEGDLWALFEHRKTGQAALNISLIDGVYIVINSVTNESLEGHSLSEITASLFARMPSLPFVEPGSRSSVQRLGSERKSQGNASNVVMLPSSSLIAFAATALLLIDLVASSSAEAADEIADLTSEHLASLTEDGDFWTQALSETEPNAKSNIAHRDAAAIERKPSHVEDGQDSGVKSDEVLTTARVANVHLNKLHSLSSDIGSFGVVATLTAMVAWMTLDKEWFATLATKIENDEELEVGAGEDSARELATMSSELTSQTASSGKSSLSSVEFQISSLEDEKVDSKLAEALAVDGLNLPIEKAANSLELSFKKVEAVSLGMDTSTDDLGAIVIGSNEIASLIGSDSFYPTSEQGTGLSEKSSKMIQKQRAIEESGATVPNLANVASPDAQAAEPLVGRMVVAEATERMKFERDLSVLTDHSVLNEVPIATISSDVSEAWVDGSTASLKLLSFSDANNTNELSLPNLTTPLDPIASSSDPIVQSNAVEDQNSVVEDFGIHFTQDHTSGNYDFGATDNQRDALVYFGGTAIVENFRAGLDIIFFVGDQPVYERVEVVDNDLHLMIDSNNKIVLTDFYYSDQVA